MPFLAKNTGRRNKGWWAQSHSAHQLATLQEQLQLANRQTYLRGVFLAPQTGKPPTFQPFGVDAQTGAVPEKNLGPATSPADEQVQVARQLITAHGLPHQS